MSPDYTGPARFACRDIARAGTAATTRSEYDPAVLTYNNRTVARRTAMTFPGRRRPAVWSEV